jgi:hypothetical protein
MNFTGLRRECERKSVGALNFSKEKENELVLSSYEMEGIRMNSIEI